MKEEITIPTIHNRLEVEEPAWLVGLESSFLPINNFMGALGRSMEQKYIIPTLILMV
jgi:hypothetical protein